MSHVFGKGGFGGFLGRTFSLKNIVPDALSVLGAAAGTLIAPGIGTAIGAGLGDTGGDLIEGKNIGQAVEGGLETGALAYAGDELLGGGAGAGGAASGSGGYLSDINAALGGIPGDIYSGIGTAAGDVASALGFGGGVASGASAGAGALGGGSSGGFLATVGNDLSSAWNDVTGDVSGGAASGSAGAGLDIGNAGIINTAVGGAQSAASGGSSGGLFSDIFGSGAKSYLKDALEIAPIGIDLLRGNQSIKGENQLLTDAGNLNAQGQALQNYLTTGTLPPGAQNAINQATDAATAAIRSQYASRGMTGSSAEAQDIASAQQAGVTQATNLATQLLQQGVSETEASAQLYQEIMNETLQQDNDLSTAIGQFAAAAAGQPLYNSTQNDNPAQNAAQGWQANAA